MLSFCPPPFQNVDQEMHNLLCPVRALDAYVHRAALWSKNEQLFTYALDLITRGPLHLSKFIICAHRKWVVEAISLAYESAGQPSPMAVRSHSTRSMAACNALISGVALQEVCDAAGWSSRTHSSDCILWTWTLPQVPKCSHPSADHKIHTGQALVAMVVLHLIPLLSKTLTQRIMTVTISHICKPYLLCACKRLAQTFKLVTASFGQAL